MMDFVSSSVVGLGSKIIDKIFPDKEAHAIERDKAKLELIKAQQSGELKELELSMSAIIAEAQSNDPWTSRARPTFLYVMYILILSPIPLGILSAFEPTLAKDIISGFKEALNALPEYLVNTMTLGYLGYVGGRTYEKKKGLTK